MTKDILALKLDGNGNIALKKDANGNLSLS